LTARRWTVAGALVALAILVVSACGSGLSLVELRDQATAVCERGNQQIQAIGAPTSESGARAFLAKGGSALASELDGLKSLGASGDAGRRFGKAESAVSGELAALRDAVKQLGAGHPVAPVLSSLQQRLAPLESQADAAWRALGIPACLTR
jgi:hypothetical protein